MITDSTPSSALVVLSGGLDSSTLLFDLFNAGVECEAVSFDYGQRHRREIESARAVCESLGVRHDVVDLSGVGRLLSAGGSALLGGTDVPEGHYADESMKATVVPNRNMIMLSIAGGIAVARKLDAVAYAAHAGDHTIYPDCRPEFAAHVDGALQLCDWHRVTLFRPYVNDTKTDIARRAFEIDVPVARTWSCYKGGEKHCGKCGTCVERIEAITDAGFEDPTEYEDEA